MRRMLTIIMDRKLKERSISAIEIEHFVLATVRAALTMAANAVNNELGGRVAEHEINEAIEPDRIVDELREDFTANVQQYWPAPAQIGSARTKPMGDEQ